jgi:diguanylate cyclase (GGDEF)-like protein
MSEQQTETSILRKPGETLRYLRNRYLPKRIETEKMLEESGIQANTPEFRKARKKFTKKIVQESEKATHDPLTGILNRNGFNEMLTHEIARIKRSVVDSQQHGHPVRSDSKAVIFNFDLNEFKQVNERFGHAGGDKHLKKVAEAMTASSRPSDIIARVGGDEFVMVLPGNTIESAKLYWENVLSKSFAERGISASIGVCELDPEHPEGSLALADEFQASAKNASRQNGNTTQIVFSES